ncbi:MAG TPA: glycosyltransferase family A protein [Gemmatimonadaceae bacterium]
MLSTTAPLFSIIVPTRNRAHLLEAGLRSVLAQDRADLELIVVDDGSTDRTPAVCAALAAEDPRVRVVRCEHPGGAPAARNRGAQLARGEFLAFNDDDCIWARDRLSSAAALFAAHGSVLGMVYCAAESLRDGARKRVLRYANPRHVGTVAVVLRRSVFEAVGGFDEALPRWQDLDLWIRVQSRYKACAENRILVRNFDSGTGISGNTEALRKAAMRLLDKYADGRWLSRPAQAQLHLELGHRLMFLGCPQEARAHFWAALRCAPARLRAWLSLLFGCTWTLPYRACATLAQRIYDAWHPGPTLTRGAF